MFRVINKIESFSCIFGKRMSTYSIDFMCIISVGMVCSQK